MEFQKLNKEEVEILLWRCQGERPQDIAKDKLIIGTTPYYDLQYNILRRLNVPGEGRDKFKKFQELGGCDVLLNLKPDDIQNWETRKFEIFGGEPGPAIPNPSSTTTPTTSSTSSEEASKSSKDEKDRKRSRPYWLYFLLFALIIVGVVLVGNRYIRFLPTLPIQVVRIVDNTSTPEPTSEPATPPTTPGISASVEPAIIPPTLALATDTLASILTFTPEPSPTQDTLAINSTFDGMSTDGWTLKPGREVDMTNPGVGGNTGGENDGHLRASPRIGTVGYYIAPPKYHGDWREFTGLRFDMWSQGGVYFTEAGGFIGDIYLANGELEVWRLISYRPPETWETFVIPLADDGNWIFGAGTMSLRDVLTNVTDFRIRAEYGKGPDFSGLDNVELVK